MLTLNDGRNELWQWDTGRKLTVDADCSQVHFSNKVFGRSTDVDVVDGVAVIPDILLQTDKDLNVWAFVGTAENGYTKISKTFKVNRRNKPADYVFTPIEQMTIDEIAAIAQSVRDDADAGMFNGKDGYTPVKGIDYFTDKDKTEIAEMAAGLVEIPDSGGNVGQSGLTTAQIDALHGMFKVCAYDDSKDVSGAYAAFKTAFGITDSGEEEPDEPIIPDEPDTPEVTLTSISAVYSGGDVAVGTAVADLAGIVVTAHYSDGSSETVTGYTLSGTIAEGSNTVTVSYGGKTAAFTVTGVAESEPEEPEIVELPNGYTQLTYIDTNKTAASFDTGVVPTANTDAEYKVNFNTVNGYNKQILTTPSEDFYFPFANQYEWRVKKLGTNTNIAPSGIAEVGVDYTVSAFGSGNEVTINGATQTCTVGTTETTESMHLFGSLAQSNATLFHFDGRMYYCKIWESDVLIRHFIPCSNPDGVIGMYDVVNGTFYQNEHSNSDAAFIGGDPV